MKVNYHYQERRRPCRAITRLIRQRACHGTASEVEFRAGTAVTWFDGREYHVVVTDAECVIPLAASL